VTVAPHVHLQGGHREWYQQFGVVLYLPRRSIVSYLSLELQGGVTWTGETSVVARALFRLVLDTLEQGDPSPVSADAYMQFAVYDLFGALFTASGAGPASSHSEKVFARACRVIKNSFRDPDVGPNEIAAETGISLRYLQKLFSARGLTCGSVIRSHRLEHAAHLLHRRTAMKAWQLLRENCLCIWLPRLQRVLPDVPPSIRHLAGCNCRTLFGPSEMRRRLRLDVTDNLGRLSNRCEGGHHGQPETSNAL
jgi:AraC-like DNA-binding protein